MRTPKKVPPSLADEFSNDGSFPIPGDIVFGISSNSDSGRAWIEFKSGKVVEVVTDRTFRPARPLLEFWESWGDTFVAVIGMCALGAVVKFFVWLTSND